MGTLTLAELKGELRVILSDRSDVEPRLTSALNMSQMRIARAYRWEELETLYTNTTGFTSTPADDMYLTFPVDVRDIYSCRLQDDANSRKLIRVPNRSWDKRLPDVTYLSTGRPSHYTLYRNVMELWPVPDAAYNLIARGIMWPTAFVPATPGAVSTLDEKDDMLIVLAASWLLRSVGDIEKSNDWFVMYKRMLTDAINEEGEKPDVDYPIGLKDGVDVISGNYPADPFVRSVSTRE